MYTQTTATIERLCLAEASKASLETMSRRGKVVTTLEYGAARVVLGGLGIMPRSLAVAAGRGTGRVAYACSRKLRRTGERNLQLAFPELSARERTGILRGCFDSLGRLLGEFSQFPRHTPESLRRIVRYDEQSVAHLRDAEGRGRGVIYLTLHLGAWELMSFAHSALEHPLYFLVRRIDNPHVEEMVESRRARFGNQTIDKKAAVRTALRVLREGGTLGILADLNSQPHEGVFVPFFGHLACTTAGVAMLALRTDAVVLPVCAPWHETDKHFRIQFQPAIEVVRTGNYEQDVVTNTACFTRAIERFVRQYPEQWLWVHKRWQTRPAGEESFYTTPSRPNVASKQLISTSV